MHGCFTLLFLVASLGIMNERAMLLYGEEVGAHTSEAPFHVPIAVAETPNLMSSAIPRTDGSDQSSWRMPVA